MRAAPFGARVTVRRKSAAVAVKDSLRRACQTPLRAVRGFNRFRMILAKSRFQMFDRGRIRRPRFFELASSAQHTAQCEMSATDEG
jgi:hypothetical protein